MLWRARRGMVRSIARMAVPAVWLMWSLTALGATMTVQAKSYIAAVNLLDFNQFDPDAKTCQQAIATVVNCGTLNENPVDGTKSSDNYRLWSEVSVDISCSGNTVSSWQFHPVQQGFGSEFVIFSTTGDLSKPLNASPAQSGANPQTEVDFSYRLRGRPNVAGVAVMDAVKHRTCSYIWHEVSGSLTCQQGQPKITARISGSGFPSHRLWVQGSKVGEVPQGPFKDLWRCDPNDPTSVK